MKDFRKSMENSEELGHQESGYHLDATLISLGLLEKSNISDSDIEKIARNVLNTMWKDREKIWQQNVPKSPVAILNPYDALILMGYYLENEISLGQFLVDGKWVDIAALIDMNKKVVAISGQFDPEIRKFTIAHELGHAVLHQNMLGSALHRDRPIGGKIATLSRELHDWQADRFATHFLMPKKLVKHVFQDLFLTERFAINEETAFALNKGSISHLKSRFKDLRGFSRFLATTEYYHQTSFNSMSKRFGVSAETMAIRLEELELIEF